MNLGLAAPIFEYNVLFLFLIFVFARTRLLSGVVLRKLTAQPARKHRLCCISAVLTAKSLPREMPVRADSQQMQAKQAITVWSGPPDKKRQITGITGGGTSRRAAPVEPPTSGIMVRMSA
jgi:hypothetical protein